MRCATARYRATEIDHVLYQLDIIDHELEQLASDRVGIALTGTAACLELHDDLIDAAHLRRDALIEDLRTQIEALKAETEKLYRRDTRPEKEFHHRDEGGDGADDRGAV